MIAVGIDVSKSKSTVAILNSDGTTLVKPYTMLHTQADMCALADYLRTFDEPITILMEYTGHYHYPVLKKLQQEGFPVCIINPYQMKKYADVEIHKAKTDKKDAIRIATYALEKSYKLVPYNSLEQKYEDLKFLSRQYNQRISSVSYTKVQLINLLDQTMPGITRILPLKSRNPEQCVLLLFIKRFKSFDEINKIGKTRFLSSYATLVKKTRDRHAPSKGLAIYELAANSITTRGKTHISNLPRVNVLTFYPLLRMLLMRLFFKCKPLQKPYRNTKFFAPWLVLETDLVQSFSPRLVIFAVFIVVKHLIPLPEMMHHLTSQDNSRAGTATSQNVAVPPSEKLVLRLCRPLN